MGIKGAKGLMGVGVLGLLLAAPVYAQDSDDNDTPSSSRADSSADPDSDVDRSLVDRALPSERDDQDIDRPAVVSDSKKPRTKVPAMVRVHLLDIDSELDADDSDKDRGDNIDRDGQDDGDRPKNKKDAPKQDAPKKDDAAKKAPAAKKPGDCVEVKHEARFSGLGYDHLVTLKSSCKKKMKCVVRTNVNSEPANVTLDPGEEETVLTWRGSPAREFTPDVKCE